jgi:hypothetical protein
MRVACCGSQFSFCKDQEIWVVGSNGVFKVPVALIEASDV